MYRPYDSRSARSFRRHLSWLTEEPRWKYALLAFAFAVLGYAILK